MIDANQIVLIDYTNWKGTRSTRTIIPKEIKFGFSEWHPGEQWLLSAYDLDKLAVREFAMSGIHRWRAG